MDLAVAMRAYGVGVEVRWITVFIDRPDANFDATARFWSAISGSSLSSWRGVDAEFATLLPDDGADAHVRIQRTKSVTSGSHIDLHVSNVGIGAQDAVALWRPDVGRPRRLRRDEHAERNAVLCRRPSRRTNTPSAGGHRSRRGDDAHRSGECRRRCGPIRRRGPVLVRTHRVGATRCPVSRVRPARSTAGHAAASDAPTTCSRTRDPRPVTSTSRATTSCGGRRPQSLGGTVVAVHDRWTVMADPAGAEYCLTSRRPSTGTLSA